MHNLPTEYHETRTKAEKDRWDRLSDRAKRRLITLARSNWRLSVRDIDRELGDLAAEGAITCAGLAILPDWIR